VLGVVARVETNRYPVDLLDPGGGVLAELVDDDVTTTGPSGERARFREIEIELAAGVSDAEVSSLVDHLVDRGARPSTSSKVLRALGGPEAAPTEVPAPDLGAKPTAREVVEAAIARSVRAIVLNLPGVRLGEDDEAVHQARVGTRRLRSDLRTFRPLLDRDWARELTDELRWLGDALGKVRDLDVMLITLADVIATERSVTPADAAQLIEVLEAERDDRRRALLEALGTTRAFELLDVLIDASQNPMTEPEADGPATDVLPRLVRKPWRRIERAVDRLDAESPDEELHAVRILAKRCRYAAEAVRPAAGKNAKRFAKAMSNVQDCLGELNDAVLISNHLRRTAAADPETAYVAGQLSGILAVRAHGTAAAFRPVWQEASKQRLRRWW
jgi:CHAD domain-containing protein